MWSPYLRLHPTMMLPMLLYHVNQCRMKPRKTMTMLDIIKKEEQGNKRKDRGSPKKKRKKWRKLQSTFQHNTQH